MSAEPTRPGGVPGPKVFITYRREETAPHAGRLYDAMVARFGEGNVFMDVDMAPGIDFVERITEAVAACEVLIVVMGPTWATVKDEQGTPRLADPEDFVRLEVETALRRPDVTPIPVLVSGARMPKREDLPPEIQAITRRNALELSDQRWRYDIGRLISALDELLAEIALVPGPPSPERNVPGGKAARAGAAQPPAQTAPPSTPAATKSVETKPAAPPTGIGRVLRWPLPAAIAIAAMAIAAIVVAIVYFVDGRDLRGLVLAPTAAPGDLNFAAEKSGEVNPENVRLPGNTQAEAAYHNVFEAKDTSAKPYWYSESTAAVFEDENAAQDALAVLKGQVDAKALDAQIIEDIPAKALGDEAFGFHATGVRRPPSFDGSWQGSSYLYVWRTGTLLQVFELDLSGPGVSEDTARRFADTMASRSVG